MKHPSHVAVTFIISETLVFFYIFPLEFTFTTIVDSDCSKEMLKYS